MSENIKLTATTRVADGQTEFNRFRKIFGAQVSQIILCCADNFAPTTLAQIAMTHVQHARNVQTKSGNEEYQIANTKSSDNDKIEFNSISNAC